MNIVLSLNSKKRFNVVVGKHPERRLDFLQCRVAISIFYSGDAPGIVNKSESVSIYASCEGGRMGRQDHLAMALLC